MKRYTISAALVGAAILFAGGGSVVCLALMALCVIGAGIAVCV